MSARTQEAGKSFEAGSLTGSKMGAWATALLAGATLLLAGCFTGEDKKGPGSGTLEGMTVTNDQSVLSERLTPKNEDVPVDSSVADSSAPAPKRGSTKTLTLTLTAEIASPVVGGDTLQATSVHLSGNFAYVSYNLQGERYRGGVDIIQLKSNASPELRSQVLFDSTDVHSLTYDGNLYLAQGDARLGASVEKLEVNGGKIVLKARQRTQLGSFAATSVTTSGTKVWVTTGNTGRLYTLGTDLRRTDSTAVLSDARWVDYGGLRLVVAQGTPCRLQVYGLITLLTPSSFNLGGCTIPQSKTTVRSFTSGRALVAAGDSGVRIVNLNTGAIIGRMPRVRLTGIDSSQTVTNAADGAGTLVYASNGEAGIYAIEASQSFDLSPATTSLTVLGRLQFANFQSANHVAFDGNTLVVAAGKGGVKVVSVKYQ